ncbi:heterokaryon incompatibility protein-domain-containing protein [Xylaria grammica]|nr:heterokaryon incompatibility protein-domain-containing protein [Xylaria grammica]
MRLLHTSLRLQLFMPGEIHDYVILSHVWGDEEIQFEDFTKEGLLDPDDRVTEKRGLSKLKRACALAAGDGYEWIWIDTCCIDKSSSAELQEAINSMWRYYSESNICYVYMADIPDSRFGWSDLFCESPWFTRGWTLQELIAPTSVEFYARDWSAIGTKLQRYREISKKTSISPDALTHLKPVTALSAAERLSWAVHRHVTREEDETYCLLGIFDPPLLADALACFCPTYRNYRGNQPNFFHDIPYSRLVVAANRQLQGYDRIRKTVTSSQDLVSTTLRLFDCNNKGIASHAAILDCTLDDVNGGAVCLLLNQLSEHESENFVRIDSPPVILPNRAEFTTEPYLLPVVVASSIELRDKYVLTRFTFTSESFMIQGWNVKGAANEYEIRNEGQSDSDLTIGSRLKGDNLVLLSLGMFEEAHGIVCRIVDVVEPARQITIRLAWIGRRWSIERVQQVAFQTRNGALYRPFHSSELPCDRCSIIASDGVEWSVALRRTAVVNPREDVRYNITVGRLEGGPKKRQVSVI